MVPRTESCRANCSPIPDEAPVISAVSPRAEPIRPRAGPSRPRPRAWPVRAPAIRRGGSLIESAEEELITATDTAAKYVYGFAEGSREMRALLGGKGANLAEMTRVLGADLVPAGFTISTEACVAYMESGGELPEGLDAQVDEALAQLERSRRQVARGSRRPAAGVGPLRRAGLDARDARHDPQPRAQRRLGRGAGGAHRQRALRLGLAPAPGRRCSATSCAASPASATSRRSRS